MGRRWCLWAGRRAFSSAPQEEFRVLNFINKRERYKRTAFVKREQAPPARVSSMPTDQHWPSVWTGPRSFHPGTVPLPLRQGYPLNNQVPPAAYGNSELMKIPNFLHLSPVAIREQCAALKKFCNDWPVDLELDEKTEKMFPLEVITSDYCHSGPSIRNPLSRIVSIRIKLCNLKLDKHSKDKFLRIVNDKYDPKTDLVTIVTDRCPLRKQNMDYAFYLLTAVYHESWKVEQWEAEKSEADMEEYIWDNNISKKSATKWYTLMTSGEKLSDEEIDKFDVKEIPKIEEFKEAVSEYFNVGENEYQVKKYKRAALQLLGLPVTEELPISRLNRS